jgi:hypothetical protein
LSNSRSENPYLVNINVIINKMRPRPHSHATRLAELTEALGQVQTSADAINDRVRSAEDVKLLVETSKQISGVDLLDEPFRRVIKFGAFGGGI